MATIRARILLAAKAVAAKLNLANAISNRLKRDAVPDRLAVQVEVNKLTNWQRGRWARAGYPGLHPSDLDPAKVAPFGKLKKGSV
jgi:hypothetical protein